MVDFYEVVGSAAVVSEASLFCAEFVVMLDVLVEAIGDYSFKCIP